MDDEPRHALSGDIHIAYRAFGDGPVDILFVPTWTSNLDLILEYPALRRAFERMTQFSRVIVLDRRGTGLSDRHCGMATLEEGVDDLIAVLDAAGSERPAVLGLNESGALCALMAASHPERVSSLILYSSFATTTRKDDYPWAPTPEEREEQIGYIVENWGKEESAWMVSVSAGDDPAFRRWASRWMRGSVSPGSLRPAYEVLARTDVRHVLPSIRVPTLILHRRDDLMVPVDNSRYLADKIPDAKLVELEGQETFPFLGDWQSIADEIEEFITGHRPEREPDRVLATILITDLADSSKKASEMGDERWGRILDNHEEIANREINHHGGRLIKIVGDGCVATFDGPARAIRCACSMRGQVENLGLRMRAGVHTGEVDLRGDDVAGIAVHIASRVSALAGAGEVLVSGAIPPLVAGSGLAFDDRGTHPLKGIDGEWRLYSVVT